MKSHEAKEIILEAIKKINDNGFNCLLEDRITPQSMTFCSPIDPNQIVIESGPKPLTLTIKEIVIKETKYGKFIQRKDNIEIRLNEDQTLDEIVLYDSSGQCKFHLEQMDDDAYWMRAYGDTMDLVINMGAISRQDDHGHVVGVLEAQYEWEESHIEYYEGKRLAAPDAKRRQEIGNLVAKYGLTVIVREIADIIGEGRNEKHDADLAAELKRINENFIAKDEQYWKAKLEKKSE